VKTEQKLTLAFALVGAVSGRISEMLGTVSYALVAPVVVYGISLAVASRIVKNKRMKQLVSETLMIFALFWLMVWVLFFNLR